MSKITETLFPWHTPTMPPVTILNHIGKQYPGFIIWISCERKDGKCPVEEDVFLIEIKWIWPVADMITLFDPINEKSIYNIEFIHRK